MKYLLIIGDGMADLPIAELSNRTPLDALRPRGFSILGGGALGRLRTCPTALPPGSDTAFLTLLGNDTVKVYTGRSPLEAAGADVLLQPGEVSFRMNLAAIDDIGYDGGCMRSHNGGGIEGADAYAIVTDLMRDPAFARLSEQYHLTIYPTDTFRHVAVMQCADADFSLTPPHDIIGQPVSAHLPGGARADAMLALQRAAFDALNHHPINEARRKAGLLPANTVWFWGAGTPCILPDFTKKYGVTGTVISGVPLVKGIARLGGLKAPDYPFATGLLDTGYEEKVQAALDAFAAGDDFVLVHLEAPDEMSHDGSLENKLESIRRLDDRIVEPLLAAMPQFGDHRILLMPDHYTLLSTRTHDGTPVPYALYDSRAHAAPRPFTESACANQPILESGDALMRALFERQPSPVTP